MQEIGLMWSVIAMLRGDKSAEFDVRKGEKNLRNESISRVQILVKDCVEKKFVGCGNWKFDKNVIFILFLVKEEDLYLLLSQTTQTN